MKTFITITLIVSGLLSIGAAFGGFNVHDPVNCAILGVGFIFTAVVINLEVS